MIRATVRSNVPEMINNFMHQADVYEGLSERAGVLARGMIIENLVNTLGESKAKHFTVSIRPHPFGMTVNVDGIDEVASYIVKGVSPHNIDVVNAQAMPLGSNIFATSVSHPGYEGKDAEIKAAIHSAALEAWRVVRYYG